MNTPIGSAVRSVSIGDATRTEGDAGTAAVSVPVTLSGPSAAPVTVQWATGGGTATPGSDYTAASGTVTFAPGDVVETVTVTVLGDTVDEPDETFDVTLANPTGATIADGSATITITDDDQTFTARYPAEWQATHTAAAARWGVAPAELERTGVAFLSYLVGLDPNAPPQPANPPPANGPFAVPTSYGVGQTAEVLATAAHFVLDGDQLHYLGGYFLMYLYLVGA